MLHGPFSASVAAGGGVLGPARAGKTIEPLAVSKTPARLTDPATAEKWFWRNCDPVLGRACTAAEKADVSAYLMSL